jgi:hypothetical protein
LTAFSNNSISLGFSHPAGVGYKANGNPRAATEQSFRHGGKSNYADSIGSLLDEYRDFMDIESGYGSGSYFERATPELFNFWMEADSAADAYAKGTGKGFLNDRLSFVLRDRGTKPFITLDFSGFLAPASGSSYVRSANGQGNRTLPTGETHPNWSSTAGDRNIFQAIIDGEFDDWLDSLAADIDNFRTIVVNPDDANDILGDGTGGTRVNRKGGDVAEYDKVVVRFLYEPNNGLDGWRHRVVNKNDTGDYYLAARMFMGAWTYIADRLKNGPNGTDYVACVMNFSNSGNGNWNPSEPSPANPDNFNMWRKGIPTTANRSTVRNLVDFFALDVYASIRYKGSSSTQGNSRLFTDDVTGSGGKAAEWLAQMYDEWGADAVPLMIAETGMGLQHDYTTNPSSIKHTKSGGLFLRAPSGDSYNERARGRHWWIELKALIDRRAHGTNNKERQYCRAIRAIVYFDINMSMFHPSSHSGYPTCRFDDWAIFSDNIDDPLDTGTAVFDYDTTSGNGAIGDEGGEGNGTYDPRPTLAEATDGTWKDSSVYDSNYNFLGRTLSRCLNPSSSIGWKLRGWGDDLFNT